MKSNKFERVYLHIIKEDTNDTVGPIGNLTLNPTTNKWDCDGNWVVKPDQVIDGVINIPFGVIHGNFHAANLNLKTLDNLPTRVEGNLDLANCDKLENIDGLANCEVMGQIEMGHNGKFNAFDFTEVMKPHTKIWDYVNDIEDPETGLNYNQEMGKYWDPKESRWTYGEGE